MHHHSLLAVCSRPAGMFWTRLAPELKGGIAGIPRIGDQGLSGAPKPGLLDFQGVSSEASVPCPSDPGACAGCSTLDQKGPPSPPRTFPDTPRPSQHPIHLIPHRILGHPTGP